MSKLFLDHLTKQYREVNALTDVSLEIRSGDFFSFLGPSGCGKTTLLRLIAGLEVPSKGRILLDDRDITGLPPHRRDTVMVFQNYALFPHMDVSENVAFGLKVRNLSRSETQQRVRESLSLVQLEQKIHSPIQDLSGGEQQRVALARALAVRPKILLMDEPLSNLDITLRADTRSEIRALQRTTKITTVYVTHDQGEALGLSDRIAVLHSGRVIQVGTPLELFEHPRHLFVAKFLGNANILQGTVSRAESQLGEVTVHDGLRFSVAVTEKIFIGESVFVAVRPEHVRLVGPGESYDFMATLESMEFLGITTEYRIRAGSQELRVVSYQTDFPAGQTGQKVGVKIDPHRCFIYPASEA